MSLLGILGIHELGHIVAAKMQIKTTWPYFIPGLPVIGIPTFGAFIQSRGLTINREILFDVAIAGPIAGLVIAVIVSIYGIYCTDFGSRYCCGFICRIKADGMESRRTIVNVCKFSNVWQRSWS